MCNDPNAVVWVIQDSTGRFVAFCPVPYDHPARYLGPPTQENR